ncbi:ribonuclease P protein component [Risungbinella massiliensis]|uniref:ribonuclease P protein component n=1 Tax=Risungbinella massiliensis TaxID=1329796 RepID=UPI0005CC4FD6|nr:ribonuclease P protein component [Risungbinella massiliensis]
MQRQHRLRKKRDFSRVFRGGNSIANRQFVLYIKRNRSSELRLGISVSKKVGNAVTRNRVKRLVKEVVRAWIPSLQPDVDLVLIARNPTANMGYHEIKSSIRHLFQKAGLFHSIPEQE